MADWQQFLYSAAVDELKDQGYTVKVKSNLTPVISIDASALESSAEPSLLEKLGFKVGVVVVDKNGNQIAGNELPETDYKKLLLLSGGMVIAGIAAYRLIKS